MKMNKEELKTIAEKIYDKLEKRERIIITSGEEIHNLNQLTSNEIMVELNIIDKFIYHGGINDKKECEKFLKRYEKEIEKMEI